jgi:D-specific alpha-keto acid dehydrogenase
MPHSEPAQTAARPAGSPAPWSYAAVPATGITVYGCTPDEAALFRETAPRFDVLPTITEAAVSEATVGSAAGNRCLSVGHKNHVTNATLLALSRAGVEYISTRSIGYDHIDVKYAESVGITVENVTYSPDGVADYTVMLLLMAVRHAKSVLRRADVHDYRLNAVRGKELRDLTVGVVGTGRIGAAVMDRLRGFGCRVLAHDNRPKSFVDYVPLDELLRQSDIVTLHTPLNADTHHLLDRRRLARMKPGAVVVNTGRGPLLDTEALVSALESGRLGGAALDVVEGEEGIFYADHGDRPPENQQLVRLQALPNVVISPHTAYHTDRALRDTVENSILNCRKFASGKQHWI